MSGQPPYPPPGNFPPFRPNFAPGGNNLPPFPPKGFNGSAPPFPPKYPPSNGSGSPGFRPGLGSHGSPHSNQSPNARAGGHGGYPPPQQQHGGGLPQHPGFPHAPHRGSTGSPSVPRRDVKTTKIFVGSIAPGVQDGTLRDLLNACGPLHELKRVEGANGKPQAFAFASFESPEVVLRCIRCLNGIELPDLTPEGRREGKRKPLVVKADQKTAEFLQEFEDTLGRSDSDENADAITRKSIKHIVGLLTDPTGMQGDGSKRRGRHDDPIEVIVPAHLQDLKEGDLPEAQRVQVLDQIAVFRENAARRERDKKNAEDDKDRFKNLNPATVGYGYGTRAFPKAEAPRAAPQQQQQQKRGHHHDPQGYSEPVNFVRPATAEGKGESERTDEEDEAIRRQRAERDKALALRDRENRVEGRERQRIDAAMREESTRKQRDDTERRHRASQSEQYESWDDDEVEERGRELFYADRSAWRQARHAQRVREEHDDLEDRRLEDAEQKALEAESEDFLKQQAAELASLEAQQRQRGLLTEDAAPIKLALAAAVPAPEPEEKPVVAPPRPALALEDDEDDSVVQKKRRALVRLEYEAAADAAEEEARRAAKLVEIVKNVPSSKRSLFGIDIDWETVNADKMRTKLRGVVETKIADALGDADADLADFVMEQIRDRKDPVDVIDELGPVLDEEAESFVIQLWRQLVFETDAAHAKLDTGNVKM